MTDLEKDQRSIAVDMLIEEIREDLKRITICLNNITKLLEEPLK